MNAPLVLSNLWSYSIQAAVVIGVGLAAPALLRVSRPKWDLTYLRMVLAAALLLPLVQPWQAPFRVAAQATALVAAPVGTGTTSWFDTSYLLVVLVMGVLARLLYVGAGLHRLRRYQSRATHLEWLGHVQLMVSSDVAGPVTFGSARPVILAPPGLLDQPGGDVMLRHELAHIRRHDWTMAMFEEFLLCVLWFHPCFWLLVDRIRLVRESVIDLEVAGESGAEAYVAALVSVADRPLQFPAPAGLRFFGRRHLIQRIRVILKEPSMSNRRLAVSYAFAAVLTLSCALVAVGANPLIRGAELVGSSDKGPFYVAEGKPTGRISMEVSIDPEGKVSDVRVLSGPQGARPTAIRRALNWEFKPGPTSAYADLDIEKEPDVRSVTPESPLNPVYPPLALQARISGVVKLRVIIAPDGKVQNMQLISGHPLLVTSAIEAVRNASFRTGSSSPVSALIEVPFVLP